MLPPIDKRLLRWFDLYVRWYLRRNFHSLHLLRLGEVELLAGWPLLVCVNHPSWWDPLVGLHLSQRFFASRRNYGAMAGEGIRKYGFFKKIGFVGIDSGLAGAASFLRLADDALSDAEAALWVTPQGEFSDVRTPVHFAAGVGHAAFRTRRFAMLPVALEYAFWTERYPEAFCAIGSPVFVENGAGQRPELWTAEFRNALALTQDRLAERVIGRDPAAFEPLLGGRAGVGGIYDIWRAARARLSGKKFEPGHGRF